VNNKADKAILGELNNLPANSNNEIWLSALNNTGVDELIKVIHLNRNQTIVKQWIQLQPNLGNIRAQLYSRGRVIEERTTDTGLIQLRLEIDKKELNKLISKKGIESKTKKEVI
jgi:50S ribosomal subunit-associated GTPase HflX